MKAFSTFYLLFFLLILSSCKEKRAQQVAPNQIPWYKTSIVYNVDVDSFKDSDGNGIGDFKGLTEQLDYLK